MQGKCRRWPGLRIALWLGWIVALAFAAPAAAVPASAGPWSVCDGPPWLPSSACSAKPLYDVDPQGRAVWLTAEVRIHRAPEEPIGVFVSAYASSAVYWDGKLAGRNGFPAERAELEKPGLRDAAFPISDATPGTHRLALQMSSHHGAVRLRSPVTQISLAPFERASSTKIRDYLPALMSAGGLLIMVVIFAFVSWGGQQGARGAYLLGAAIFVTAQLGAEASRVFLDYPYPAIFLRIWLVLAMASGFGFMLLAYLVRRFDFARLWPVLLAQTLGTAISCLLVPSFDQKTGLVLTSSTGIGLVLAIRAASLSKPGALPLAAMLALGLTISLADQVSFLDRNLYLWTAGLFLLLFSEEARRMKASLACPAPGDPDHQLSESSRLPRGLCLGTAAARRFLLPDDIVRVAAADDYSEVFLVGGGSILHPEPLQKLLERLPAKFVRTHRSHAINLSHLRSFRKGQSSSVILSDQSVAPVSRRRVPMLLAELEA
jgi:hypothetical protein